MTKAEWEGQFSSEQWKKWIAEGEQSARENAKQPHTQCCFGMADRLRRRCPNASTRASTFYGHTTGLAWCPQHGHGDRTESYPHGEIDI